MIRRAPHELSTVYIDGVVVAPTPDTPVEMSYVMTNESDGGVVFHFEAGEDVELTISLGATALRRPSFTGIDQGSQVPEPAAMLVFRGGPVGLLPGRSAARRGR